MICRLILPDWAKVKNPTYSKVIESDLSIDRIIDYNLQGYNCYYLPNSPEILPTNRPINGTDISNWEFIFVDMDLKRHDRNKQEFINILKDPANISPHTIVDSGNGIHAYWKVSNLTPIDYLRFQRRLCRYFSTDEAVSKIYQLMRIPETINTKQPDDMKLCQTVFQIQIPDYTPETIDKWLPLITPSDHQYCEDHYSRTYSTSDKNTKIQDEIPHKFHNLLKINSEVKKIWAGGLSDRSGGDWRLAHIMLASGFTKEEALSVLVNSPKALERSSKHNTGYAINLVDKLWIKDETKDIKLSQSVKDILNRSESAPAGARLNCYSWVDNTDYGFRLGHVMGLVAGSGVGKTVVTLNIFMGFVESNPEYDHFFVSLEQPDTEIAERWKKLCGGNSALYDRVHILSNYNPDGSFRRLSLDDIRDYLIDFQKKSKRKIGCCVIDHIGVLSKQTKNGENQGLIDVCHQMKSFAIATDTFLIMQSQAPREKAGIGDLEINKDAAFGTVFFESYCDFLMCIWQPLKRCHMEDSCPTITAFKFAKIRHKHQKLDKIKEDICYKMFFEPDTGILRQMTENENKSFQFFIKKSLNKRKLDRKTDLVAYHNVELTPKLSDKLKHAKENFNGKTV